MPVFQGGYIPQWAKNKGAYTVEYAVIKSPIETDSLHIDIEIFTREQKQITESFSQNEIDQLILELGIPVMKNLD
jgi:hypothetical protein